MIQMTLKKALDKRVFIYNKVEVWPEGVRYFSMPASMPIAGIVALEEPVEVSVQTFQADDNNVVIDNGTVHVTARAYHKLDRNASYHDQRSLHAQYAR